MRSQLESPMGLEFGMLARVGRGTNLTGLLYVLHYAWLPLAALVLFLGTPSSD